jgi:hypothetical protein
MDTDLDTLVTALYVTVDDMLIEHPEVVPPSPPGGWPAKTSNSEMITLAVMAALWGITNEHRWVRYAKKHLTSYFPHIPNQPGYNKRLRRLAETIVFVREVLARQCDQWSDGVWVADSTPVECARSAQTVHRSELAGYAQYGYCASHSRWFWGFRLHLVATVGGLIIGYALTGAKTDERATLASILAMLPRRQGQVIIADKGYRGKEFEQSLTTQGIDLLRPALTNEAPRPGSRFFKPLRQVIESINATLKTQLDIEHHRGRTLRGVICRISTQLLALTAIIWHNEQTGQPTLRHLTPYDH